MCACTQTHTQRRKFVYINLNVFLIPLYSIFTYIFYPYFIKSVFLYKIYFVLSTSEQTFFSSLSKTQSLFWATSNHNMRQSQTDTGIMPNKQLLNNLHLQLKPSKSHIQSSCLVKSTGTVNTSLTMLS